MTLDHLLLLLNHEAEHFKANGVDLRRVQINVREEQHGEGCWRDVIRIESALPVADPGDELPVLTLVVTE